MNQKVTIELTDKITDLFRDRFYTIYQTLSNIYQTLSNDFKVPTTQYKHIEIVTYNFTANIEQMEKDLFAEHQNVNALQKAKMRKLIKDYANSKMSIKVEDKGDTLEFYIKTLFKNENMKAKQEKLGTFTYIKKSGEIVDLDYPTLTGENVSDNLIKMFVSLYENTLAHLDKPTTVQTVDKVRVTKRSSKKKGKKPTVKYVYKTVYKITDIQPNQKTEPKETVKSHQKEREYNMEEWERKGHYRTYRNRETGEVTKEVWIKPTTCRAKGKVKENVNYKITRIN